MVPTPEQESRKDAANEAAAITPRKRRRIYEFDLLGQIDRYVGQVI
jgi:hypothetical protein